MFCSVSAKLAPDHRAGVWNGAIAREVPRSYSHQMIDHVSIPVRDLRASAAYYEKVLQPLGLTKLVAREHTVGFGKKYPEFWLNHRPNAPLAPAGTGAHVCLRASSREAVDMFHSKAVEGGGKSDGLPGDRSAAMTTYYGAFILDLDGNKVEAVTFPR